MHYLMLLLPLWCCNDENAKPCQVICGTEDPMLTGVLILKIRSEEVIERDLSSRRMT